MKEEKEMYLKDKVKHIPIDVNNMQDLIESFSSMAFQSRNLANAAKLYKKMLSDQKCSVILTMAGCVVSAGLKKIVCEMIDKNMIDAIVSTGAIIVDMDFLEALGFNHYQGTPMVDDEDLRKRHIDRIYDTYIDEDELRVCDETIGKIADSLEPKPYSSREFIIEMGKYLDKHAKNRESIVLKAYKKGVPIFCPAFSDSSAGFGFVLHQTQKPNRHVSIDSAKDFLELTRVKISAEETGLLMLGGGVPKNFAQDTVVAAEVLGKEVPMHKYAIQITVADERDGACSSSTLKEAHSWGKVDDKDTQMVFSEYTIAFPLIASYAYHSGAWKNRKERNYNKKLEEYKAKA